MVRRRSGRKIDFTHWTNFSVTQLAQSAGAVGIMVAAATHEPETLLRTRGNLLSFLDGSLAPGRLVEIVVGLILVPEGTGTTVLWSPATDGDAPWFYWTGFQLGYNEGVTDVVDIPGATSYREIIDDKAMRIIRNQEIQMVVENTTLETASSVNTSMSIRMLAGK